MRQTCAPLVSYAIPLHRLPLEDSDVAALTAAIGGGLLTGGEQANQRLAALAERTLDCLRAFPASSGTHALELMMRALVSSGPGVHAASVGARLAPAIVRRLIVEAGDAKAAS